MRYYPCRDVAVLRLYILLYSDLLTCDRSTFFISGIILSTQGKRTTEVCNAIALCKYWVADNTVRLKGKGERGKGKVLNTSFPLYPLPFPQTNPNRIGVAEGVGDLVKLI